MFYFFCWDEFRAGFVKKTYNLPFIFKFFSGETIFVLSYVLLLLLSRILNEFIKKT